jgi:hypothetical protein
MIEQKDVLEAIDRIARTPDGQMLFHHLQKILLNVATPEIGDGALRQLEGRRMFASELMGLMAKGIADSDRYAITFVRPSGERAPASRGAARRVTADTVVPGWDSPALGGGTVGSGPGTPGPDAA